MRDKLADIVLKLDVYNDIECEHCSLPECDNSCFCEKVADYLIQKGVVIPVQCKDCIKSVHHEIFPHSRRCKVEDCKFPHKETHFCSYGVRRDQIDKRHWLQKFLGYCPCCGRWFQDVTSQRRLTEYENEESNYLMACKECHEEDDAYWEERWAEYNASRL